MEKKTRNRKQILFYGSAVLLGVGLCGFALFIVYSLASYHDGPLPDQFRLYEKKYTFGFNPRTVAADMQNHADDIFYEKDAYYKYYYGDLHPVYTEDFYLSLPAFIFLQFFDDDIEQWEIYSFGLEYVYQEGELIQQTNIDYRFGKNAIEDDELVYKVRSVEIEIDSTIKVEDYAFPSEIMPDEISEGFTISDISIGMDEAINIVENESADLVFKINDLHEYTVEIYFVDSKWWHVHYMDQDKKEIFAADVNVITGEVFIPSE